MNDNRRVRIFVSSTFLDMKVERNELMTQTWPKLRRFCRERQVELVEVDLRWGIAEEQSTRKETLKLCLNEIGSCRPFFIGLLGERYGWTPGEDAFTKDLQEEQPWLKGLCGKSVTELEILHGVLNNPDMAGRSFFYFRDPQYVVTVPASQQADFAAENAESTDKQKQLKTLIRQACATKRIPLRENYSNPCALATLVLEDLKAAIEAQFPIENVPDALTREMRDHEAYAEIRRRTYIGREGYFKTLNDHAAGSGGPLVLLGESGSGKSALLANWLKHWREAHPRDFTFQHYIGGTPDSADHWRLLSRLTGEIKRWTGDPEELPKSHKALLKDFPIWLAKARSKAARDGVRCMVVLDALNQLEDRDHARALGWLPIHPFTGPLRLVVSTLPGDTLEAVRKHDWKTLSVESLIVEERRRMIEHYLGRFGKKLDAHRLDRLSTPAAAANPLFLKILLDELRVTGTHDQLDERLNDYLAAADIPELLQKVLDRYQRDYERDYPGLVGEALGLIWAARRGLTETELLRLLKPADKSQLPPAIWNPLRSALEDGLVDRSGILNFAHDFLRAAVETALVPVNGRRNALRLRLADFFEAEPVTVRSCDELPWLLWQAKKRDRLRDCLLEIDRFLEILERDQEELMHYWVGLREDRTMGKLYLISFEQWSRQPGHGETQIADAAIQLGVFLHAAALYVEAEPLVRQALTILEQRYGLNHPHIAIPLNNLAQLLRATNRLKEAGLLMERVSTILVQSYGPVHSEVAIAFNNRARFLQDTNRQAEAEPLLRQALAIDEHNFGPNHPRVASRLNNLARLLLETNRLEEAERLVQRALAIDEQIFGADHPNVARDLTNLAQCLQATNRLTEAERLMRRILEIYEQSFGRNHPDVANAINNLALLLQGTNRLAEAERLMRRAVAIYKESYGPDHPEFATVINNLAIILYETNCLAEAEPLLRQALAIDKHSYGLNHQNVARDLNNLATLLQATNRLKKAERLRRRALVIDEQCLGSYHPEVAKDLYNLATMLQSTNRLTEADPLVRRALAIYEKNFGLDHPCLIPSLNNLAILLFDTDRLTGAEQLMRRMVLIMIKVTRATGEEHPHLLGAVGAYAALLQKMGRSQNQIRASIIELAPEIFKPAGADPSPPNTRQI